MSNLQWDSLKRFLLLYASQTGQAKAIAEEIAQAAPSFGLKADLQCLSLTDKRFCIENESCVVFIVSTTGDGEPPDTAVKFYRRICRHTLKTNFLEKLHYAILALGDSNYIKFCLFGRLLGRRLKALSGKPFYEPGYGDDAFGIETGVDPWIMNLWPVLQKQLSVKSGRINGLSLNADLTEMNGSFMKYSNAILMESSMEKETEILSISDLPTFLKDFDVKKCRVPKLPTPALEIVFNEDSEVRENYAPNDSILNSQASPISQVKLVSSKKLTHGDDVKPTLELKLQFQDTSIPYKPGDSYGFICPNPSDEVDLLFSRLNVLHLSENCVNLRIPDDCVSKRKLPVHIPPLLTLRDIFLHCVEIRSVPKKILLRVLAEYANDAEEKNSLLYLSSPEGSKAYTNCIRKPSLSVIDILLHYKSCAPPIERLLEYLPCLKPRFYSVASTPLEESNCFKVVFNVLKIDEGEGRRTSREGVCTGWFNRLSTKLLTIGEDLSSLTDQLSALNIDAEKYLINVYKRTNPYFYLPESFDCPIIMIGPGTGIAPFIGFLHHCKKLMETDNGRSKFSSTWLFYGCRYKEKDFLYRTELQRLQSSGVLTHLLVSFSRESVLPPGVTTRYVHESIRQNVDVLAQAVEAGGRIYVCGDAKHMAQDVQQAFIEALQKSLDLSQNDAKTYVEKLQTDHRYINDVWA